MVAKFFAVLLVLVAGTQPALAAVAGKLSLVSSRSGRAARGVVASDAIVAFTPDSGSQLKTASEPLVMRTVRKAFDPESLVVPVGSQVAFPNRDPILHNVFSVSPTKKFDVGVYGRGEGKVVTFDQPGLVRVFCNVHQTMFGHILVLDTPFYAKPRSDGSFTLADAPSGPGTVTIWHPRSEVVQLRVNSARELANLRLPVSRRQVPRHLNKFGKPYRSRRDRYN